MKMMYTFFSILRMKIAFKIESVGTKGNKILERKAGTSCRNTYLFHVVNKK